MGESGDAPPSRGTESVPREWDVIYSQGKLDLAHPTLTQSWLTMHEDCAYAAYRRYILGDITPPNEFAIMGSGVDRGITHGANQFIRTGKDAPLKDKVDCAIAEFDAQALQARFVETEPGKCRDMVRQLVELHHREIAPSLKPILTQEAIVIPGKHYDLAGTIDMAEADHTVVDHKTSRRRGNYVIRGSAQPALYTFLYARKHGVASPRFRYDVLVKTKVPKVERVEGRVSSEDWGLLFTRFRNAFSEMVNSLKTGRWRLARQGHWKCNPTGKWCSYVKDGCPKGRGA